MKIFKRFLPAGFIFSACVLCVLSAAEAAVPGKISYQGTLRKDGILYAGTVAMEFRITNSNGGTVYWTSGSTDVYVSGGLFRYTLGTPNETSFAAIQWPAIDAYMQVLLDGNWLPPEPLFSSAYALHALRAEGSTGDFTAYDGNIRISTTAGNIGLVFQDGTTQYTSASPVWSVSGTDVYISSNSYGNAGIGNSAPEARLDVQAAAGGYPQIWRDSSGVIQASMSITGLLYADASQMRNIPSSADNLGSHIAAADLNMAGFQLSNAGAVTASSYTAAGVLGIGAAQVRLAGNVAVSSEAASALGGGVRVSSNIYIVGFSSAAKYYGDGSALSFFPVPANIMSVDTNQTATGVKTLTSSFTVTSASGIRAPIYNIAANVAMSAAPAPQYGGVYVSTHVYLPAGARYYGDGSALTGVVGLDNLGDHTLAQNLTAGSYWFSGDGGPEGVSVDASGNVSVGGSGSVPGAKLDVRGAVGAFPGYIQIWRNTAGVVQSSMTDTGILYADGSQLRNTGLGTATQNLNMSGYNIIGVSTITVSSITSSGAGVVFSTNIFIMQGSVGINTTAPQEKLQVNGSILSSDLTGAGNRCVYVDLNGVMRAKLSDCGVASGGDEMGLHKMTQNLAVGNNWISYAGGNSGLSVNTSSNVGVGILSAVTRLDVQGGPADPYIQIWRDSGGTVQSSMTSAGILYADGSQLRNLSPGSDNLGAHIATQTLNMAGYNIIGVSTITVSSITSAGAGVIFSTNVYIVGFSSAAKYYGDGSALTGVVAAGTGFPSPVTTNLDMNSNNIIGVSTITVSSITSSGAGVVFSTNVFVMQGSVGINTTAPQEKLQVNGSILSSDLTGAGNRCMYVDLNGVMRAKLSDCGVASGGDEMGLHKMTQNLAVGNYWISYAGGNSGLSVNTSSNVGVGILSAAARLDVQGGPADPYIQIWRDSGGTVQSSMSATGILYADGSKLRNLPPSADSLGTHIATQTLNMAGYNIIAVSTITVSSIAAAGSEVTLSADLLVTGNLGVNTSIRSSSLIGGSNRCVYVDTQGIFRAKGEGSDCGLSGVIGDNLGNYTFLQNLLTNGHWISYLGADDGLILDSSHNLGVGNSGYPLGARLDVTGSGGTYTQIWRNNSGIEQASMTATGILYADGSQLRNLPLGADDLGDHTATQNLNMADYQITNAGAVTASSYTATGVLGMGAAQVRLAGNVVVSSEAAAAFGGGVRVSSNIYIVGFSSAVRYYGDGSALTGITGVADDLGDHTATQNLNMAGKDILSVSTITVSSITTAGAGVVFSTNVYIVGFSSAAKYYGDGSALTGVSGSDNLGSHIATTTLDMAGYDIIGVSTITVSSITSAGAQVTFGKNVIVGGTIMSASLAGSGAKCVNVNNSGELGLAIGDCGTEGTGSDHLGNHVATTTLNMAGFQLSNAGAVTASSYTATGVSGIGAAQVRLAGNVIVSSEAAAGVGGGVRVSSNIYIVGFSSAGKYYGDGSALTGVVAAVTEFPSPVTTDLDMAGYDITGVSTITVSTITGISGARVVFSTSIYIVGYSSAARYFGDGSKLTGITGDNLGNHTATELLNMNAFSITNAVNVTMTGAMSARKVTLTLGAGDIDILPSAKPSGGVEISTTVYLAGYLLVSSHSVLGNNATTPLTNTALVLNEVYEDAAFSTPNSVNMGLSALCLSSPTVAPASGATIIGGNFRAGIEVSNTYDFDTLIGLKSGAWNQTSGIITNAYGIYTKNVQTMGTVTNSYGVYIQNQLDTGIITNNYGVYVAIPDAVDNIANEYGVYIADRLGFGNTLSYNLYSAGAASKNKFEGAVSVGGGLGLASKAKAALMLLAPAAVGEMYFCTDCGAGGTTQQIVVSTGTSAGNFSDAMGGSSW